MTHLRNHTLQFLAHSNILDLNNGDALPKAEGESFIDAAMRCKAISMTKEESSN